MVQVVKWSDEEGMDVGECKIPFSRNDGRKDKRKLQRRCIVRDAEYLNG